MVSYAPVFDQACLREEMAAHFGVGAASPAGFPNDGGFSNAGSRGDAYYFYIVGFVAVTVGDDLDTHVLYGAFSEALITGGILPDGYDGGSCSTMLYGISLWE